MIMAIAITAVSVVLVMLMLIQGALPGMLKST
jgi:hypothetical protein